MSRRSNYAYHKDEYGETKGKSRERTLRIKHILIREATMLRNRYLHFEADEVGETPTLTVDTQGIENLKS
jgi:hypothetical protein